MVDYCYCLSVQKKSQTFFPPHWDLLRTYSTRNPKVIWVEFFWGVRGVGVGDDDWDSFNGLRENEWSLLVNGCRTIIDFVSYRDQNTNPNLASRVKYVIFFLLIEVVLLLVVLVVSINVYIGLNCSIIPNRFKENGGQLGR